MLAKNLPRPTNTTFCINFSGRPVDKIQVLLQMQIQTQIQIQITDQNFVPKFINKATHRRKFGVC